MDANIDELDDDLEDEERVRNIVHEEINHWFMLIGVVLLAVFLTTRYC